MSEAEKHRRQKTSVKRHNENLENTQSTDAMKLKRHDQDAIILSLRIRSCLRRLHRRI